MKKAMMSFGLFAALLVSSLSLFAGQGSGCCKDGCGCCDDGTCACCEK